MVRGRARVLLHLPPRHLYLARAPTSSTGLEAGTWRSGLVCLKRSSARGRFYLSHCAALIICFDLTPKRQVIANKRPELHAAVVNNNTTVPRLTPHSFSGQDHKGQFVLCFREVGRSSISWLVPGPAVIYLSQHRS